MLGIGLYIHIPFCAAKCAYCNFYSMTMTDELADQYTMAAMRALEQQPFGQRAVDTVYFGGGTPLLLGAKRLSTIFEKACKIFRVSLDGEITLEANPAAMMGKDLASLRKSGFNRISFGVQSGSDDELKYLGRLHRAKQAKASILEAYNAGFENISADLMLGIPGQTQKSLGATIDFLSELPLRHISAYMLKVEEGTPLASRREVLALCPDEDEEAALYLDAVEHLRAHGFIQYEISNFAKKGQESRHNLKYWLCEPYLGIGPSAHSFMEGRRFFFPNDLQGFLLAEQPFTLLQQDGEGGTAEEYAMLRLRLSSGLSLQEYSAMENAVPPEKIIRRAKPLIQAGLVHLDNETISLTPKGFLLSSSVTATLLYG